MPAHILPSRGFKLLTLCLALLITFFYLPGLCVAQNTSATLEDLARLAHEQQMQAIAQVPLEGFFLLCSEGSAKDVQKALDAGADPQAGDPAHGGTPPLSMAAGKNQDPDVIRVLLKAGANVNHVGKNYGRTALHQAVLFNANAIPVVKALLESPEIDLFVFDIKESIPLDYAIDGTITGDFFDGKPREDLILVLLKASQKAPFTLDIEKEKFFKRKYNRYISAFEYSQAKPNPKVIEAFKKLGVDVQN